MNLAELSDHLDLLGLPLAYHHFDNPPNLPYIVYLSTDDRDLKADNINYVDITNVDIELYSDKKDLVNEKLIQDKLKELKISYKKYEAFIQSEKMYQILYEIQII